MGYLIKSIESIDYKLALYVDLYNDDDEQLSYDECVEDYTNNKLHYELNSKYFGNGISYIVIVIKSKPEITFQISYIYTTHIHKDCTQFDMPILLETAINVDPTFMNLDGIYHANKRNIDEALANADELFATQAIFTD